MSNVNHENKLLAKLNEDRAKRRNSVFDGPVPTMEQLIYIRGYDESLSLWIETLERRLSGIEDGEDDKF